MLKRTVHRAVGACGYQISRIPSRQPKETPRWPVDPAERSALLGDLERFAREKPGRGLWSSPSKAREYLSDKRLCFYSELLKVCDRQGIRFSGADVADIGSGTGYLLRKIHASSPDSRLTGYDTYPEITELARALCPAARFVLRDLHEIGDERYDVIFCTEVLEHLFHPGQALRQLLAALRAGGTLVLTVPNGRSDTYEALGMFENGRGHWGHINFWSPESWPIFVREHAGEADLSFGTLPSGENYAVIRPARS